jgi:large subunit ribosomal protein L21
MYVIFQTGGKQYRAQEGLVVRVEKLPVDASGNVQWHGVGVSEKGTEKVVIKAQALEVRKEPKVIIFKKKRRHNYRRKLGHRQSLLHAKIVSIQPAS